MNIAMIGTGYVGLVSGVCFSEFGFHVTCVDKDGDKIAKLQQQIMPIYEPGLEQLVENNRKAGRLEIGITYYRKALAINPDFVLAREYLGEGYVAAGRIDLAKLELNEIKNRAGASSEEYQDLSKAITTGVVAAD